MGLMMCLLFYFSGRNAFSDTRFNILFPQYQDLKCIPELEDTLAALIKSDMSTGRPNLNA